MQIKLKGPCQRLTSIKQARYHFKSIKNSVASNIKKEKLQRPHLMAGGGRGAGRGGRL